MRIYRLFAYLSVFHINATEAHVGDDASMIQSDDLGFAEFEDENLLQFAGGASTEFPSLDEQEVVLEARAEQLIKDEFAFTQVGRSRPENDDEHSMLQDFAEFDEQTFFQYDEPQTYDDHHFSAHSRFMPELVDDYMGDSDEYALVQQARTLPLDDTVDDDHSMLQEFAEFDEQTFFQYDEPETRDDHVFSAHSRFLPELVDDYLGDSDEYALVQQAPPAPCYDDDQSLLQDFDEQTFFQYDEPQTYDDHVFSAHSRWETLDDSIEDCDEHAMFQKSNSNPENDVIIQLEDSDEQTFFQYDEPQTYDDHHFSSHSRWETLDDSMEEGDEYAMVQRGSSNPENDEIIQLEDSDEQTFFQYDEPQTYDDHHFSSHSRWETLDDSMEEGDEYAMVQQGVPQPCYDGDDYTFFQVGLEEPQTRDDHHLSVHSRFFPESVDNFDENSMFQQGGSRPYFDEPSSDEQTFFQYEEPQLFDDHRLAVQSRFLHQLMDDSMDDSSLVQSSNNVIDDDFGDELSMISTAREDVLAEEAAMEEYSLMQHGGTKDYPSIRDQESVQEARREVLQKGDPYRFFGKEEL